VFVALHILIKSKLLQYLDFASSTGKTRYCRKSA
jgi:hypothetical protein